MHRFAHCPADGGIALEVCKHFFRNAVEPDILPGDQSRRIDGIRSPPHVLVARFIRLGDACKAPFAAQHVDQKPSVLPDPGRADPGKRSHHAVGRRFGDPRFKRLQINFADGLFVCPYGDAAAETFLIVQCKVLGEHDAALLRHASGGGGIYFSGKESVFRIIFKISAAVRAAVNVCPGTVYADIVGRQRFFSHRPAELFRQLRIKRRSYDRVAGKGKLGAVDDAVARIDAHRPVGAPVPGGRNALCPEYGHAAEADHIGLLLVRHLVEQVFPHRIGVRYPAQLDQRQPSVRRSDRFIHRHRIRRIVRDGLFKLHCRDHVGVCTRQLHRVGIGICPVAARKIGDLLPARPCIQVHVYILEPIGDARPCKRRNGIGIVVVARIFDLICQRSIPGAVHPVRRRIPF